MRHFEIALWGQCVVQIVMVFALGFHKIIVVVLLLVSWVWEPDVRGNILNGGIFDSFGFTFLTLEVYQFNIFLASQKLAWLLSKAHEREGGYFTGIFELVLRLEELLLVLYFLLGDRIGPDRFTSRCLGWHFFIEDIFMKPSCFFVKNENVKLGPIILAHWDRWVVGVLRIRRCLVFYERICRIQRHRLPINSTLMGCRILELSLLLSRL